MSADPREPTPRRTRYRFGDFIVSTSRRQLLRSGREVPLIPRYFDLLVLLIERRHEAVHRREILDGVWNDVVVSDGALSQAIRTLRRTLGDDSLDAVFIRTVSRHGYRFAFADVIEEPDLPDAASTSSGGAKTPPVPEQDPFEPALERVLAPALQGEDEEGNGRREAAEMLHVLGTSEALRRLDRRPGHEAARALLRDTRWDVPGAGPVPLLGQPGGVRAARMLVWWRLRRALRVAERRWAAAAGGGAVAGALAGLLGGFVLRMAPGSPARPAVSAALAVVGAVVGGLGAAGVGAGLAAAEALARSSRGLALVILGGLGGGLLGAIAHAFARWTLEVVFGSHVSAFGGGIEGVVLGSAAGLGYALATPRPEGGMATPRGTQRLLTALSGGVCCGLAGVGLTLLGGHLAGVSLHQIARSFQGSEIGLEPLARLLGERELGPLTRGVLGGWEGVFFGFGLTLGLTRRPVERSG